MCLLGRGDRTIKLQPATSPLAKYHWLDVADHPYSEEFRKSFNYNHTNATFSFDFASSVFKGRLDAKNLKPNFAYQIKLVGEPGLVSNEWIGLAGRWWQETWDGTKWSEGQNLNDKGDGTRPNPNDEIYIQNKDLPKISSPTGLKYRYTSYMLICPFITDSRGQAGVDFLANSSLHVIWKTSQRKPTQQDGSTVETRFTVKNHPAYDQDFPEAHIAVFGEWERLPVGQTLLPPGTYKCQVLLTEESFHSQAGEYTGAWAAALKGTVEFNISPEN